jgi:hypothetical protein
VILLYSKNLEKEGNYAKIFKFGILGVDVIQRLKTYVCKIFKKIDEGEATILKNKEAIGCPFYHPIFVKIFAIRPTKPHGYM